MNQRPGPRDRLLKAAKRLTYTRGPGVGIDTLLKEADVARRSLYEHFGGKDGLLVAVLQETAAEDEQWYRSALDAGGDDPRRRLLALFDALDELVTTPGFRGCRYLTADLALADAGHPVHAQTAAHRRRIRDMLQQELTALGHPAPGQAASQLQLLAEGTLATGATAAADHPGRIARSLAEAVLDEARVPTGHA